MKYRTRTFYADSQKALMWERWKEGATLHQIAKLFDRGHTSVQKILAGTGGIPPADRHRARVALTLAEREEISRAVVIDSNDCCIARASPIHGQPRDQAQRRPRVLSGEPGRPSRLGSRTSSQALQAGAEPDAGTHRDREASKAVVARADCRMAQAYLSAREPPRVTRDHLSQPLHPGARRPEEGAPAALEAHPRHASVPAPHPEDRYPWQDRRRGVDQ